MSAVKEQPKVQQVATFLPCWCGGPWENVLSAPSFGLVRCKNCLTYCIDPPPISHNDHSEAFYTDYYSQVGTGVGRAENLDIRAAQLWEVISRVPALNRVGRAAADIGCGDGHLCARLRRWGWQRVVGFEISQTRAERARRLYPEIEVVASLPEPKHVPPGGFDLVVMEAVIEHIPDPVSALRNVRSMLSPGGLLVMTTPNMASGNFQFLGRRWTGMLAPHAHVFLFDPGSISRLLESSGYEVVQVGSYHEPVYRLREYMGRLASGDVHGTLWKIHQELGGLWGRVTGSGPFLFSVARASSR